MNRQRKIKRFEAIALPHLGAAYNLARWLTRDDRDAQDIAQEAYLRAFESFDGFHGEEARAWLFTIVHSTYYIWLRRNHDRAPDKSFDEESRRDDRSTLVESMPRGNPEFPVTLQASKQAINKALERLPVESREIFVLRELEELSYREIADIVEAPIETVMSRLARAGILMQEQLEHVNAETPI